MSFASHSDVILKSKIFTFLNSCDKRFAYPFGLRPHMGFGADYMGLLSRLMSCLECGIKFSLCKIRSPQGFSVANGWSDYFEPFFDEVDSPLMGLLNRHEFPYQRIFPLTKTLARAWLRNYTQPQTTFFAFDKLPQLCNPNHASLFDLDLDWVQARGVIMKLLWKLNVQTQNEVSRSITSARIPERFYAMHIRRGDKKKEFALVPIEKYVFTVNNLPEKHLPLFVASDDFLVVDHLRRALPRREIISFAAPSAQGHDNAKFNMLPLEKRRMLTVALFADLECLRRAQLFVGTQTSNIGWMINSFREGEGIVWT
jgi:hypothetical protein